MAVGATSWYDVPVEAEEVAARLRAAGCVYAEEEAGLLLDAAGGAALERLVERRAAGEPLEHLLGWAEFAGRRLVVAPPVFVPRRRTELLARCAVAAARAVGSGPPVVVELCAGAAPVASVAAAEVPGSEVWAVDADPAAVACARENLGATGTALLGDLDEPLPGRLRGRVDVLAANPPHVPTGEIALMPAEARDHEARLALDGGSDGTDVLERLVALAPRWLAPGGVRLLEAGRRQAAALGRLLAEAGWTTSVRTDDDIDGTVLEARPPDGDQNGTFPLFSG